MANQKGQVILVLILVMTVALAIGLSIVQRSLSDVSTASKVEQSSRAFSAAEAGIEKALRGDTTTQSFTDNNSSITQIVDTGLIPCKPGNPGPPPCTQGAGARQAALEYPPLAKEDIAHVWLADLNSSTASTPPNCGPNIQCHYLQNTLDIFWGNSATDKAAMELTLVYYDNNSSSPTYQQYVSRKWFLDDSSAARSPPNGFDTSVAYCGGVYSLPYRCYKRLGDSAGVNNTFLPSGLILIRARLLYNTTSQPIAVQAVGTCGKDCSIPPQARSIESTGVSGETQRRVRLFQLSKVVPPYFDYAIFSGGEISK